MRLRNVTITLEEEVARWTRVRAAQEDTSVSRLVGQMLKERMLEEQRYRQALERFVSRPPIELKSRGAYPTRDQVHER